MFAARLSSAPSKSPPTSRRVSASSYRQNYRQETRTMRFKKRKPLFSVLLDTGINLLDSLRERLPDNADDIKDRVRDTYATVTRRVSRATDALRGEADSQI